MTSEPDPKGPLTLEEIAVQLDMSPDKVRQIEQRAMKKLLRAARRQGYSPTNFRRNDG